MLKNSVRLLLCIFILTPSFLMADEPDPVIQIIEKALDEYKNQDFTNAATSLDYASQLIRQKKGEALSKLLPEPMEGWTANEGKSQVTAASLFGGGLTAERTYRRENSTVTISIVTDSPLLQSMIMMFSNPIFASAAGQFELINGYKGIVSYEGNGGKINIVLNNRFVVTLDGQLVTREELMDYARKIDLKSIANLP
ncbi:MAG: hypothetical protein KKD01_11255 [Proteobacteria bacterium]|nr:hypothetical protein [Pseudomonadota bacterium]MBU1231263.1 hypothetical protein [Pseudomonadota bacterium]MBU1417340.1 hypothetical protein [Pseudomonadota bacterium]MBU1455293.1 hypothetical protein [Pseudomonadota bacterium]